MSLNSEIITTDAILLDDAALDAVSGGLSTLADVAIGGAAVGTAAAAVFVAPAVAAVGVGVVANSFGAVLFGGAATAGAAAASAGYGAIKGAEAGFSWLKSEL